VSPNTLSGARQKVTDRQLPRQAKAAAVVNVHTRKVHTLSIEPAAERLLATASGDNTVKVWDVRSLSASAQPQALLQVSTRGSRSANHRAVFLAAGRACLMVTGRWWHEGAPLAAC
jgi:WD40 repeat protein